MNKKSNFSRLVRSQEFIVFIILIAMYIVFGILNKQFLKYTTFVTMFDFANYYILMAFGVGLCLITGGVDLSIGTGLIAYAAIGGAVIKYYGANVVVGIIVTILIGVLFGLANGKTDKVVDYDCPAVFYNAENMNDPGIATNLYD